MKNEKLELLLNKVVDFNEPSKYNFRGFLYKDGISYYIKVVEVVSGNIEIGEEVRVKEKQYDFIIHAEKPKLMRVSMKSWHYRLVKYVLKDNAPTPKTMQNGCPYFWLLMLSILVIPFIMLWKLVKAAFLIIPKTLFWGLGQFVDIWMKNVDDKEAYDIYWNGRDKMPLTSKMYFNNTNKNFLEEYILERYGIDSNKDSDAFYKKKEELANEWRKWADEREKVRDAQRAEARERQLAIEKRRAEFERKKAISDAKWEARMKPIRTAFKNFGASINKAFTFNYNWNVLIRRTKQVVGGIITLVLLVASFFIVNLLAYGFIVVVDAVIAGWMLFAVLGVLAVIIGIIYVLYILFTGWIQAVVNKYRNGKRVWYVEPFIYLLFYPIKYVVLGIAYSVFYVILIPLKFIFVNILWKLIIVNLAKFIWKGLTALGRGIAGSTGIFGEYFDANYTDYCPGIEWVDTEEDK